MSRALTILCLLLCSMRVQSAPINAKLSNLLMQPAVATLPPSVLFTVTPPTVFSLLAAPNLRNLRSSWGVVTNGTNSVSVPISWINKITNQPTYSIRVVCHPILTNNANRSVILAWNRSTDPIVAGYNIYYGGASGTYTNEICVGNATNATISGLIQGTTYYFAATTYASSGAESLFSSEVSYLVTLDAPTLNTSPGCLTINFQVLWTAGLMLQWGVNNFDLGLSTNFFVTGLSSTPVTFTATAYTTNGQSSLPSNVVTTSPDTNWPPLTVFFTASASVPTKLTISK